MHGLHKRPSLERRAGEDNVFSLDEHREREAERRAELHEGRGSDDHSVSTEPSILHVVTAQLAVFPDTLKLRYGPILVALETWTDGVVVARWPEGRLYGEGSCDTDAIRDLADNIEECAMRICEICKTHKLGGAALEQWRAISAMFCIEQTK
jgi:hypothetical protein